MGKRVAVVTGANRGIGFEICRQLARQDGLQVVLTARNMDKGLAAQKQLANEGLKVDFELLDVSNEQSREDWFAFQRKTYGRLDVLVNNAGMFIDAKNPSENSSVLNASLGTIRHTLEANLYGPLRLCQLAIPLMQANGYGRIVNLSSGMGQLTNMNGGYPGYRFSKVGLNALTRTLADEVQGQGILVNSMCPGWVRTQMGGPEATRDVEEGAKTAVWLATLPEHGPSGGFFRDCKPIPW